MATTSLKRIAANTLASYISSSIPGLAGKVSAVAAGPDERLNCLALKIVTGDAFRFEPAQPDELYFDDVTDDGKLVVDVGSWSGNFTLELYATSAAEREEYQQALFELFYATEWAPGTIYLDTPNLTISGYASLYSAQLKYRLESETWIDEMAFESKRYTFAEVFVDYPALVTYNAPTIDSLQIWLSELPDDALIIEAD